MLIIQGHSILRDPGGESQTVSYCCYKLLSLRFDIFLNSQAYGYQAKGGRKNVTKVIHKDF